jgi:lactoylglutathione lyase
MITRARSVGLYVKDQDRALDFFVNRLGFHKLVDHPMGPEGRWIEVAPPGAQTVFVLFTPTDQTDRIGTFSNVVFACDDIHKTHRELSEKAVEFVDAPADLGWGLWATFKDPDGNVYGLTQRGS